MTFLIWGILTLLACLLTSVFVGDACKKVFVEKYDENDKKWSAEIKSQKDDYASLIEKRDKEITDLTMENITLTRENEKLENNLVSLKKKYDIKSAECVGLHKNSRLWHENYEELESHINEVRERCSALMKNKETEHQKEIEDLTRYYKEKIQRYTRPVEGGNCQNVD